MELPACISVFHSSNKWWRMLRSLFLFPFDDNGGKTRRSICTLETLLTLWKESQISLKFENSPTHKCTKIVGKYKECNVYAHFILHKAWHARTELIKKPCDSAQIYLPASMHTTTEKARVTELKIDAKTNGTEISCWKMVGLMYHGPNFMPGHLIRIFRVACRIAADVCCRAWKYRTLCAFCVFIWGYKDINK